MGNKKKEPYNTKPITTVPSASPLVNNNNPMNINILNPRGYNDEAFYTRLAPQMGAFAMVAVCVPNNIADIIRGYTIDTVTANKSLYRHDFKRLFNTIPQTWNAYESNLLNKQDFPMFKVERLTPETRKLYGESITDRDYFEFWKAQGTALYHEVKPFIDSARYKYYKSLTAHGVTYPDEQAMLLTFNMALRICQEQYESTVKRLIADYAVCRRDIELITAQFSLAKVREAVLAVLRHPAISHEYQLTPEEKANITLGVKDYADKVTNQEFCIRSVHAASGEYEEMFRTKGYQKKALSHISNAVQIAYNEQQKRKIQRIKEQLSTQKH